MKDYSSIWLKWEALLASNQNDTLLQKLNIEVRNGFDVIVRIADEELTSISENTFEKYNGTINEFLAHLIFDGYTLFLIQNPTDPDEKNLIASIKTSELGNKWMESFESDKGIGYVEKIDPMLALLLENRKGVILNNIFSLHKELFQIEYKFIQLLELYFRWTIQQGFIVGIIENELNE